MVIIGEPKFLKFCASTNRWCNHQEERGLYLDEAIWAAGPLDDETTEILRALGYVEEPLLLLSPTNGDLDAKAHSKRSLL